jgi:hypothetical protein
MSLKKGTLVVAVAAGKPGIVHRKRSIFMHDHTWPKFAILGASIVDEQLSTWSYQAKYPKRTDGKVYRLRHGEHLAPGAEPEARQLMRCCRTHRYRGTAMVQKIAKARNLTARRVEQIHRRKDNNGSVLLFRRFALPGLTAMTTLTDAPSFFKRKVEKMSRCRLPWIVDSAASRKAAFDLARRVWDEKRQEQRAQKNGG